MARPSFEIGGQQIAPGERETLALKLKLLLQTLGRFKSLGK